MSYSVHLPTFASLLHEPSVFGPRRSARWCPSKRPPVLLLLGRKRRERLRERRREPVFLDHGGHRETPGSGSEKPPSLSARGQVQRACHASSVLREDRTRVLCAYFLGVPLTLAACGPNGCPLSGPARNPAAETLRRSEAEHAVPRSRLAAADARSDGDVSPQHGARREESAADQERDRRRRRLVPASPSRLFSFGGGSPRALALASASLFVLEALSARRFPRDRHETAAAATTASVCGVPHADASSGGGGARA